MCADLQSEAIPGAGECAVGGGRGELAQAECGECFPAIHRGQEGLGREDRDSFAQTGSANT